MNELDNATGQAVNVDPLVMPSPDSIRAVIDGIFTNSQTEFLALDEAGLDKFWHFRWSDNCDFAMNLYRFHKALSLYGNFCRRWEELHNGTCCVVERVRDKYLLPKFQMLIEMANFNPEEHLRKLGQIDGDDHLYWTIDAMVQRHDISKLSFKEFIPYQQNFYPVGEKETSNFKNAWAHHLTHNPHHWESWIGIKEKFPNEQACHCVCMVIDWMAMGMKFGDTAEEYYELNKHKIYIPGWAKTFIQEIFSRIKLYTEKINTK